MYDVIGDVHGCYDKLCRLLEKLGYSTEDLTHPDGRKVIFAGDIMDRGSANKRVFDLVFDAWKDGRCIWVRGNHDDKFFRWLKGNPITVNHGLQLTVKEFEGLSSQERLNLYLELKDLPDLFQDAGLTVVHAYPTNKKKLRMYGPKDSEGNRIPWWEEYDGERWGFVCFGHYWLNDPEPRENWCCVDVSACITDAELVAFRWPEKEIV